MKSILTLGLGMILSSHLRAAEEPMPLPIPCAQQINEVLKKLMQPSISMSKNTDWDYYLKGKKYNAKEFSREAKNLRHFEKELELNEERSAKIQDIEKKILSLVSDNSEVAGQLDLEYNLERLCRKTKSDCRSLPLKKIKGNKFQKEFPSRFSVLENQSDVLENQIRGLKLEIEDLKSKIEASRSLVLTIRSSGLGAESVKEAAIIKNRAKELAISEEMKEPQKVLDSLSEIRNSGVASPALKKATHKLFQKISEKAHADIVRLTRERDKERASADSGEKARVRSMDSSGVEISFVGEQIFISTGGSTEIMLTPSCSFNTVYQNGHQLTGNLQDLCDYRKTLSVNFAADPFCKATTPVQRPATTTQLPSVGQ